MLALVSLAISLLLWLNGLVGSLQRPSVGNDLNRRQLELAVLAEPVLPPSLRPLLAGTDPKGALAKELQNQITALEEAGTPAPVDLQLETQWLRQGEARAGLAEAELPDATLNPLLRLWTCRAGGGSDAACGATAAARRAALQLLAVTLLPALVLLAGVVLVLRELWLRSRGRAPVPAPLVGPPLSGIDVVLLIAGGFVVLGELLTPVLISPLLSRAITALGIAGPLQQGLTVLGLYLALMAGPLLILALMLRQLGPAPDGGWLQFRWLPFGLVLRRGLITFVMALPLVSLVGWLQTQLWGDPGGSNPLLELVLTSRNGAALTCFGVTAIVLAPLFEETLFRGVLLPVAGRELGAGWGVLISAAVFALAHLSIGEFPPLFVLGLGLGWLRWSSGRLGASVLMHGLWNAMTFTNLVVLGS